MIGAHQKQIVADVEERREDNTAPAGAGRDLNKEGQAPADQRDGGGHHRHRPKPVRTGAQQGVPTGVKQGGQQDDEDDADGHSTVGSGEDFAQTWRPGLEERDVTQRVVGIQAHGRQADLRR